MTWKWTDWRKLDGASFHSPYTNWMEVTRELNNRLLNGNTVRPDYFRSFIDFFAQDSGDQILNRDFDFELGGSPEEIASAKKAEESLKELLFKALGRIYLRDSALPPMPFDMITSCNGKPQEPDPKCHIETLKRALGSLPAELKTGCSVKLPDDLKLPNDTIVAGVIDVGIALGHRRFRLKDGKTRVLAAWQQSANRTQLNKDEQQTYLPFGQEFLAQQINRNLEDNTHFGSLTSGQLDEEAFNRATCLEDYRGLFGQREVGHRAAHGTHALDCVFGADAELESVFSERCRSIVVNLPDRALVGHSAQFLEFFAIHGILRIIILADAIWHRNNAGKNWVGPRGYDTVINLSFGKQAGPRDGFDLLAGVVSQINEIRKAGDYKPVYISLPAGNENLNKGNTRMMLRAGANIGSELRLVPQDQSSNFVEFWGPPIEGDPVPSFEIEVETPTGAVASLSAPPDGALYYRELMLRGRDGDKPIARLYGNVRAFSGPLDGSRSNAKEFRTRFVLATRPTQIGTDAEAAPAGGWKVRLHNPGQSDQPITGNVQTDQTVEPHAVVNQLSFFDDPSYERFHETGRIRDSYDYPLDRSVPSTTDNSNFVRRHGTINAVGSQVHSAVAAGYQRSDGRMIAASSTGTTGEPFPGSVARQAPTVSLVVRDGPGHFGILGSGARDGSTVAMEGTSFAASKLSRRLIDQLIAGKADPVLCVTKEAKGHEAKQPSPWPGQVTTAKAGAGRLIDQPTKSQLMRFRRFGVG